jgi:hypothetical protein
MSRLVGLDDLNLCSPSTLVAGAGDGEAALATGFVSNV